MATNPFGRLTAPAGAESKIPVHPFFIALTFLERGWITPAQFNGLFGTDNADLTTGQIETLVTKMDAAANERAKFIAAKDVWHMALLTEWDTDDVLGLHSISTFGDKIDQIVAHHNGNFT